MAKRMGDIVQHGDRWIITDEGRALQTIDDLRGAIDHALAGDLFDAANRLAWLGAWREADKMRERLAANRGRAGNAGALATGMAEGRSRPSGEA